MRFDYFEPVSLAEARDILRKGGGELKPFSGGTDIVIQLRRRLLQCRGLVNLKRIPELSEWQYSVGTRLRVGSCTRMRDLEISETVRQRFPSVWESLRVIGSIQLRNLASVGGNLCNASPSADMAPSLITVGATVNVSNDESEPDAWAVEDFFKAPGVSVLRASELLRSVDMPEPGPSTGNAFERFTPRSAMDIAIASAAAHVTMDSRSGRMENVRIALGAVAPTPMRAFRTEDWLREKEANKENLAKAGRLAMDECSPIDDIRASAAYRRELIRVLVKRVVQRSVARAEERGQGSGIREEGSGIRGQGSAIP